jgi:hypothetical protein
MTNVLRLPTAATSYIQMRKAGDRWAIEIVTPMPGRPLRTPLATCGHFETALAFATETAEKKKRPLRLPKGGAA